MVSYSLQRDVAMSEPTYDTINKSLVCKLTIILNESLPLLTCGRQMKPFTTACIATMLLEQEYYLQCLITKDQGR